MQKKFKFRCRTQRQNSFSHFIQPQKLFFTKPDDTMKKNIFVGSGKNSFTIACQAALILIFNFLFLGRTASQVTLFSASNASPAALNVDQFNIKQSYEQRSNFSSIQLINLASPASIQESKEINVQIPGAATIYTFSAITLEAFSTGDFYWYGDMIETSDYPREGFEDQCLSGQISIIGSSGKVFGEMRIDTNYFQIPSLGNGLNALVKLTQSNENECINYGSGAPTPVSNIANDRELCPVVRMLILYTQETEDAFPDIQDIGMMAFNNTKQALTNSKVSKSDLDLQLAGIELLPGFSATGFYKPDRASILTPGSTASQLRSAHFADVVMILTPPVYPEFSGYVFAFGDSPAQVDSAYTFVEADAANLPTWTLVHEFGHLFGGRHQRQENFFTGHDDSGLQDAHGYFLDKGKLWWYCEYETVVGNTGKTRILHYSNPDVKYKKKIKTGQESWANNAKTIRNATCRVSAYQVSRDISVSISNPNPSPAPAFCPGNTFILYGTIIGDFPPYTYQWRYRLGSGAWVTYTPPGSPDQFQYTIPANYWGMIHVELTASNGTDQAIATNWVYSDYVQCPHFRPDVANSRSSDEKLDKQLICAPNPATNYLQIQLPEEISGTFDVLISNSLGKLCLSQKIMLGEEPTNQIGLDLPSLPNGQYILTVRKAGSMTLVGKFAIIK